MTRATLTRWGGLALLAAGLLLAAEIVLHPDEANPSAVLMPIWGAVHAAMTLTIVLSLFGLAAMYAHQSERAGGLGLAGFILLLAGSALFVPIALIEAFVVPALAAGAAGQALLDPAGPLFGGPLGLYFLLTGALFALGSLITAVATLRAEVLPRLSSVLFVGGALLAFAPPLPHLAGTIGGVLLGLGYAWCGYAIWAAPRQPAVQPRAAT